MREELYQQTILEHNRHPCNFKKLEHPTHTAEGYNPLCGDHWHVYVQLDASGIIQDLAFEGSGCAISKASASMMTSTLKGRSIEEAKILFNQFHQLVTGALKSESQPHQLGKLTVFSGICQYPARVKCASLAWHTLNAALEKTKSVSTE